MSDLTPYIYRYHSTYRPEIYFNGGEDNGDNLFLGIELEFDTRKHDVGSRENKIDLIQKSNNIFENNTYIYYMLDGSLTKGLEMITQPATYNYHMEMRNKYEELFSMIKEKGFKSQSYKDCGLHIHFNRSFFSTNEDLYIINLLYLIEKFWKDLVLLSRRNYDALQRWARKDDKNPEDVIKEIKNRPSARNRYHAINLVNYNTIEFRFYRGTLDIDDFMAIIELTKNLIVCAKNKNTIELQSMKFSDLLTSPILIKYSNKCHRKSAIDRLPEHLK